MKTIERPRRALGSVAAATMLILVGCQKPAAPPAPLAPTVGIVESRRMNVPLLVTPNGTTRALEDVTIRARVRGFLTERHFEEGAFVKKGELLLVIDEEPYRVALDSARAKLAEAEAARRKAEDSKVREVAAARLELSRSQLLLAQIHMRRSVELRDRNAVSSAELDEITADHQKWKAQVEADSADLEQARTDYTVGIASAKAQVAEADAAVHEAELNLGYCRMYAPLDGRIGEAKVKVGNLVGPDAAGGGTFTDLATIHQLDPIGVDIRLSSKDLDRTRDLLRTRLAVRVSRPGPAGDLEHPEEGTCYFVDNQIDELTSTFLAKARIPNPGGTLLPGEYVKVRMEVGRLDDSVVVPAPAVMESETGPIIYVVDAQRKVAVRSVKTGPTHAGLRVITHGLAAGVPVIVEGLQSIRPGLEVQTEPSALAGRYAPPAASTAAAKPPTRDREAAISVRRVATATRDSRS